MPVVQVATFFPPLQYLCHVPIFKGAFWQYRSSTLGQKLKERVHLVILLKITKYLIAEAVRYYCGL
jgi:hypothetical protein